MTTCAPAWYFNSDARAWPSTGLARDAGQFHRQLPGYQPTPVVPLPDLAAELGVGQVFIKDESSRLGLTAFKILGASWACANLIAGQTGAELKLDALRAAAEVPDFGSSLRRMATMAEPWRGWRRCSGSARQCSYLP